MSEKSGIKTVYAMRHGLADYRSNSNNPPLTEKGRKQTEETVSTYLRGMRFNSLHTGKLLRQRDTAVIALGILPSIGLVRETQLLSLTDAMSNAARQCAVKLRKHPEGVEVGFRVDTWIKENQILMGACASQFKFELRNEMGTILVISSSPIVESIVPEPEKFRLLGTNGIIKYIIRRDEVLSAELIFEGFF